MIRTFVTIIGSLVILGASAASMPLPSQIVSEEASAAIDHVISAKITTESLNTTHNAAPESSFILDVVDKPGIAQHQKLLADQVLKALPAGCRENLRYFYVPTRDFGRRAMGGRTTIMLYAGVYPRVAPLRASLLQQSMEDIQRQEFAALLVHECAHVILGNMIGTIESGKSGFHDGRQPIYNDSPAAEFMRISWKNDTEKKYASVAADFASGYAKSDPHEDFAEFFASYILQPEWLALRAQKNSVIAQKLAWMQYYLPTDLSRDIGHHAGTKVPWDITILPFDIEKLLDAA